MQQLFIVKILLNASCKRPMSYIIRAKSNLNWALSTVYFKIALLWQNLVKPHVYYIIIATGASLFLIERFFI